jgi:2,5-diketo-D-gluconate reductase B
MKVPTIGLGTWRLQGDTCYEAVRHALELGYRHVDTARMYRNEHEVGRALRDSGVDREAVWLTTKLWHDDVEPDRLPRAATDSLRRLGTDYVDLLLLHWPFPEVPLEAQLHGLVRLRDAGTIRELGVSNYPPDLLRRALREAPVFCDQVEYHPYVDQSELLALCVEHGVLLTAYSPIAKGRVADDPVLAEIGAAHGKSPAQVALRWLIDQPMVAAIPRSASARRRAENLDIFDFALTPDERTRIDDLARVRST